ncbi:MAG: TlpA family protein disulfide reductase [Bryobacteraceae bacterium]|nr:TlpA family protein disulfide reductase [Bryobacteraceae bacterium]MDW8380390.1 TlpA disulfide reductase family protein [Bryobacterales bacterium]
MFRILPHVLWVVLLSCPLFAGGSLANRRAPGFSLPDTTGKQHDPQDYRGKVILLDFMQTGCPSCKALTATLEQLKAKFGSQIQVLSVVVPPDTLDTVQRYIKEQGVSSPVLFDCGQMTASYLRITPQNPKVHFPHLFLIDSEGFIRNDYGHSDLQGAAVNARTLAAEIERILAGGTTKKR